MSHVLIAEGIRSEVVPGVGLKISSLKVRPGEITGIAIEDPRLRKRLSDILDRSVKPLSGKVKYLNQRGKPASLRTATLSFDRCYIGDMTINEYLDHFRLLAGLPKDEMKREDILGSLNITSVQDCRSYTMPFEGRGYIELARCLYCEPELLIMDLSPLGRGIGGDPSLSRLIAKYLDKRYSACIMISDGSIFRNSHIKRLFYNRSGEIVEDSTRERDLRTLGWKKYIVGVENLGDSISFLEKIENVEVMGSLNDEIAVAIGNGLDISDLNKNMVDSGMRIRYIIPHSENNKEVAR